MRGWLCAAAMVGLVAGCESRPGPTSQVASAVTTPVELVTASHVDTSPISKALIALTVPIEPPTTRPAVIGSVSLTGQVKQAGLRDLCGGEKISDILRTAAVSVPASKLTVVLVRRCPEGTTSEMIDIDQNLAVLDARRDYALRDGDELVVSVAPAMPEGLARPMAVDLPPAH